ncbi:MAG TPA: magnesium transporter CorA family protein [Ferrovibrio sp.]|jgi:magnesium transporter|uniref:magnesium transporter CorA family protein n=1 Tax=Ferrovibrio sp. TaxID=1917215 RepID=UPI002B4AD54D|nr:magnesium transporter CorA family protein [Ferrovibrio sp.]HLT78914.1 magnesium transporter CorA family protein [Ferrovibrio sp.]
MITAYLPQGGQLHRIELTPDSVLPEGTVWVDLLEPTPEEEKAIERLLEIEMPTREEMQEIEISSRLYREGDASYMTANILYHAETPVPQTTAVTFMRTPRAVVTLRFADPLSFRQFVARAQRQPSLCATADAALCGILDSIIDRAADVLEVAGKDLDGVSRAIFGYGRREDYESADETDLEDAVRKLGRVEDLTSRIRDSLVSLTRLTAFLNLTMAEQRGTKEARIWLKTLSRDVQSLSEQAAFLAHKGNFLLDATLGLINIQQTKIIKIFSVAATVFLPPTLIASIYGMNFEVMPELSWSFGYPLAILLMIGSAVLPYWWFKRKGWL